MASWNELDRFRKILVMILVAATVLGVAAFALIGRQEGIVHDGDFLTKRIDQSGERWNTAKGNGKRNATGNRGNGNGWRLNIGRLSMFGRNTTQTRENMLQNHPARISARFSWRLCKI